MIDDLHKRFIKLLEHGCVNCDVDALDGNICHCRECEERITAWAYELLVIRMEWPEIYDKTDSTYIQRWRMRRITEIPADCIACGWHGVTGNCEPDKEGQPCCPECKAVVFVDYHPEELIGDERSSWLTAKPKGEQT